MPQSDSSQPGTSPTGADFSLLLRQSLSGLDPLQLPTDAGALATLQGISTPAADACQPAATDPANTPVLISAAAAQQAAARSKGTPAKIQVDAIDKIATTPIEETSSEEKQPEETTSATPIQVALAPVNVQPPVIPQDTPVVTAQSESPRDTPIASVAQQALPDAAQPSVPQPGQQDLGAIPAAARIRQSADGPQPASASPSETVQQQQSPETSPVPAATTTAQVADITAPVQQERGRMTVGEALRSLAELSQSQVPDNVAFSSRNMPIASSQTVEDTAPSAQQAASLSLNSSTRASLADPLPAVPVDTAAERAVLPEFPSAAEPVRTSQVQPGVTMPTPEQGWMRQDIRPSWARELQPGEGFPGPHDLRGLLQPVRDTSLLTDGSAATQSEFVQLAAIRLPSDTVQPPQQAPMPFRVGGVHLAEILLTLPVTGKTAASTDERMSDGGFAGDSSAEQSFLSHVGGNTTHAITASPTETTAQPVAAQQVIDQIATAVQDRRFTTQHEMSLMLTPPELGSVRLKVVAH
ncbi:MAG TPA: hypothetical protein VGM23_00305, partial [Armatimonadota bacterium]